MNEVEIEDDDIMTNNEDIIDAIGERLRIMAQDRVAIRADVEKRWLDDLDQYMGKYDEKTLARLDKSGASKAFVNITRPKVLSIESRLSDMLFPSDDKNWAIQPTPVPELHAALNNHRVVSTDDGGNPVTIAQIAMKAARKPCQAMEREIDDQLTECNYYRIAREVIHDACLFGTGIIKAPVIVEKTEKKWIKVAGAVHELSEKSLLAPSVERVDPFNFFPDMAAHCIEDSSGDLERRYMTRSKLRKLSNRPGYKKDRIQRVIQNSNNFEDNTGTHISHLRELSDLQIDLNKDRFEVWEYHGTLSTDELRACGCDMTEDEDGDHSAVVVFVNGVVIKADLNIDETGDSPYSLLIYEKDDSSIWGLGIPYLLRNEQRIANAAWRMALDNAALTTGPQIVVNREVVVPSDGDWTLKPRKVWWLNSEAARANDVFATHEISGHQQELINLYELAKKMADEVTNMPLIAQGDEDAAPDTATGTSMLMNVANSPLRHIVKRFDDNVTKPVITRFYNWNMQNSDKEEIKGDFNIDARGSSALLVKETQNHALMNLLTIAENPVYAPLTKHAELYRKAVQSQHINADDVIKTDEEIAADAQKPDPQQQQMVQLQIDKLTEEINNEKMTGKKIQAETTVKNVEGLYSAINAAKEVAALPAIAPMADEVYKSAGGVDYNGFPIINNPQEVAGVPPQDNLNTHPQYPPNPDVGMMAGIDK